MIHPFISSFLHPFIHSIVCFARSNNRINWLVSIISLALHCKAVGWNGEVRWQRPLALGTGTFPFPVAV